MLIQIPADFAKHAIKGEFGPALANAAANIQQAGVYVLSMKEMGQLLNNKEGLRILREGMQMGEKGQNAWKVTGQLLAHVFKDSTESLKEGIATMREPDAPNTQITGAFRNER